MDEYLNFEKKRCDATHHLVSIPDDFHNHDCYLDDGHKGKHLCACGYQWDAQ